MAATERAAAVLAVVPAVTMSVVVVATTTIAPTIGSPGPIEPAELSACQAAVSLAVDSGAAGDPAFERAQRVLTPVMDRIAVIGWLAVVFVEGDPLCLELGMETKVEHDYGGT